jgi:hypothetical protein
MLGRGEYTTRPARLLKARAYPRRRIEPNSAAAGLPEGRLADAFRVVVLARLVEEVAAAPARLPSIA